jgi:hypothetical protein
MNRQSSETPVCVSESACTFHPPQTDTSYTKDNTTQTDTSYRFISIPGARPVNRRDRRSKASDPLSAQRIRELQHRVEQTGQPGIIAGLTDACRDCTATGEFVLLPGRQTIAHIWHDDGCPAAGGITPWQPHPLDDE